MNKFQSLRNQGKLSGTIKRAVAMAASRAVQALWIDSLITARSTRPKRAIALRAEKLAKLVPTRGQAVALAEAIRSAVSAANGRCKERLLSDQSVVNCAREVGSRKNGGVISCGSYKYNWTTTACWSSLSDDGQVSVRVDRTSTCSIPSGSAIAAPLGHWRNITLDDDVLAGGGVVAIRRKSHWECLDADWKKVGVCVRVTDPDVVARFGQWEHGATIGACRAETARKAALILEEDVARNETARRERTAKILVRIGCKTDINASIAHAAGACQAGIAAFAARVGKSVTDTITLTDLAEIEPVWAIRIAQNLVVR